MQPVAGDLAAEAFDRICRSRPGAHRVIQWGGARVWKVGPRVFAIGAALGPGAWGVSVKVTPIAFEALRDVEGYQPAPYLASRGLTWLQVRCEIVEGAEVASLIEMSHRLVTAALPARTRRELGLSA